MDNSFNAGRGMPKWPFNYGGTTPAQKTRSRPLPGPGPTLQPFSYGQMPATSALAAPWPAWGDNHWLCWPVLGQGKRSSSALRPHSQLSVCAGCPSAGQASGRSTALEHSQSHCPAPLCASPTRLAAAFLWCYCCQFFREQEQRTVLALKNTEYKWTSVKLVNGKKSDMAFTGK